MFRSSAHSRRADLRAKADEDLMVLVADGDARAFEVIFDRHSGPAYSLAHRICSRPAVAEDVVQEAFLSLWRSGGRYQPTRGSVRTWVLGIVHHRAIDAIRQGATRERRNVSDEGIEERLPAAEDTYVAAARRDEAQQVRGVLGQLPTEQRQVIELAFFGGFTHTQIAELLKLPSGTVKGRMRLGLSKMRGALGDRAEFVL